MHLGLYWFLTLATKESIHCWQLQYISYSVLRWGLNAETMQIIYNISVYGWVSFHNVTTGYMSRD